MGRTGRARVGTSVAVVLALGASACSGDDGSRDEFCAALPGVADVMTVLGDFDSDDSAAVEQRFADGLDAFRELEDAAPGEVRDDVDALAAAVELILAAVRDHPDDTAAIREQLAPESAVLADAGDAAIDVSAYALTECGIDLGTASDPTAPPSTTPPTTTTLPSD